jgi:hypothetical protein
MHSTPNSWLVARLQAIADGAGPIRHATTRAEAESVLRRLRPSLADSAVRLAHVGRELPLYFDGLAARDGDVDDSLMPARIALSTAAGKGVAASFSASLSPLCESQVATLGLPAPMAAQLNKMHASHRRADVIEADRCEPKRALSWFAKAYCGKRSTRPKGALPRRMADGSIARLKWTRIAVWWKASEIDRRGVGVRYSRELLKFAESDAPAAAAAMAKVDARIVALLKVAPRNVLLWLGAV